MIIVMQQSTNTNLSLIRLDVKSDVFYVLVGISEQVVDKQFIDRESRRNGPFANTQPF